MSRIENAKLAVIGAGSVGTSLAYAALIRGSARTVALYDLNGPKVDAEVLDLAHGTQFTGAAQVIGGADPEVVAGAHIVVVTAGAKQHPGQSRLDLAGTNVRMLETLLPQLMEHAPHAVYCIVTNPCDVLTVAAQQITGLPSSRVFSSGTTLDTSRLRRLVADRAQVSTESVHADIVGEHGDTGFALWSQARIGPVPILDWVSPDGHHFTHQELDEITESVRQAAYRVIEGKGATNYAIGLAGARIVEAVLNDQQTVLPVGTVHEEYRGTRGVAFSVPSVVGRHGVQQVLDLTMTAAEERQLRASADALHQSMRSLGLE
ncbi:L-lactate dehydrogenase [Cellulomonas denverensis]|uniref:L-lactate dehydrogenase n=1 Tax=Cellulomonas denverensis TaxID=264297 RepID=A0A7X6QYR5_9CELL|nr:L-lactate dehydrogenase [Cellulomonas denverensis]NKY22271.1 L-lactate dehydrogenase [Cellulomonas denverensis]GIG26938.1 L-lactate dehydrogenase 2 [Cellulomonas denverensis]